MGQKFFEDKIILSESAGTISLGNGSRVTIGGQQYSLSAAVNVAADTTAAVTRYQVYAVESGGAVSLVTSTNENSVGPAGHSAWKLVGSYFSGDIGSFGSFVTITGKPETNVFECTPGS
jgi:hypothetical protein